MIIREKSKALATLMSWHILQQPEKIIKFRNAYLVSFNGPSKKLCDYVELEPYAKTTNGLMQFAKILLSHIEVWDRFNAVGSLYTSNKPTQKNILDEILLANNVKI